MMNELGRQNSRRVAHESVCIKLVGGGGGGGNDS